MTLNIPYAVCELPLFFRYRIQFTDIMAPCVLLFIVGEMAYPNVPLLAFLSLLAICQRPMQCNMV